MWRRAATARGPSSRRRSSRRRGCAAKCSVCRRRVWAARRRVLRTRCCGANDRTHRGFRTGARACASVSNDSADAATLTRMATLVARLADAASRRRRLVVGAWLALLLAGGWFSLHQSSHLSGGGWDVPGSASVRVGDALDSFPSFSSPALSVLVTGRSSAAVRERLAAVRAPTARDPNLKPDRPRFFVGGRAALLPVTYTGPTR